jgi:thymidylate synthase
MNTIDSKYQDLLQDILDNGVEKQDRTGTGTISVFGRQIRHKMSQGFPLLTTKKMPFGLIAAELLWFLRGDTNIKFLLDYNCHIWDGDAYKGYEKQCDIHGVGPMSKEQFISAIKLGNIKEPHFIPDLTGYKLGDLGPIYGKQWRQWQGWMDMNGKELGSLWYDQILEVVHSIKTNPDSRRLMVSAWNVAELGQMVLPPCHYGFQFYTRELGEDERLNLVPNKQVIIEDVNSFANFENRTITDFLNDMNVPSRAISLMWNQRSVDTFLGLPFNIASYGLLLEIIAREVNMVPDELIGNLGDVHLYSNHIEQAKEQIGRDLTDEERYNKWFNNNVVSGMERFFDPNNLPNFDDPYYEPTPKRTREPFELPKLEITERNWYLHAKVKEHLGEKTFKDKILSYRPDCFEIRNYQSHSKLRAPLSN